MNSSAKRILVIDDDDRLLLTTAAMLEEEGYEVHTHKGGFGASNRMMQLNPDLVLLDVNMPGLSGEGLASVLRKHNELRHIPIVFFSSNDEDSLRAAVQEYGVAGYLCKGDWANFARRVAQFLERSAA